MLFNDATYFEDHIALVIGEQVWTIGGMILTGTDSILRKMPIPVPFCPPYIPHGLAGDQTQASAVTGQQQTA